MALSHDAWRKQVLSRDGYKCVVCGSTERLHADHIKPRCRFPELAREVDNGRTLCRDCHHKTDTFGGSMRRGMRVDRNPYGSNQPAATEDRIA
jgi:5-methylcytosine-specific restriction endonuclease McrA